MYDLIVIGAGPAGMTAGIYAKRANLKVLVVEKSAPGGQIVSTGEIENYPGFSNVNGADLAMSMFNHAMELGVEFEFDGVNKVLKDGDNFQLELESGNKLQAKTVLITSGAVPRRLGVEGEDQFSSKGISWCAICDGPFYKGQRVAIIGGGNSAIEYAVYMAGLAKELHVIQNLDKLTADAKTIDQLAKMDNVTYHYEAIVTEFKGSDKLESLVMDTPEGEKELEIDGVFEYIGLVPVTDMVKDLGITNKWGYIETNDKMETKIPGLYGAGDVVSKQIRQIVTATGDGAVAVQNIIKYLEEHK